MNKEELDSFESLDIGLNDIDDLDMGLEVISYKARVCIQELSKVVMEQSSQLQSYKYKEEIKNLERNADFFKEQMEDAVLVQQTQKELVDKIKLMLINYQENAPHRMTILETDILNLIKEFESGER